jgi:hypothetical protein
VRSAAWLVFVAVLATATGVCMALVEAWVKMARADL